MATPYVKFLRGTAAAYASAVKDKDTLYFVSEVDQNVGKLYLGDVLIAGNVTGDGTSIIDTLAELTDVDVAGVAEGNVLAYKKNSQGVYKWMPTTLDEALSLPILVGATADAAGTAGLVPAPSAGDQDKFLKGDGTWAPIVTSANTQVFEIDVENGADHNEALAAIEGIPVVGDIAIVREVIYDDKKSYTAYVYNGTAWTAMDGNYNAENVYFDDNLTYTSNIGVLTVPSTGSGTIKAQGKNIKEVLAGILAEEKNPTIVQPSISAVNLTGTKSGTYEVGTNATIGYSVAFDAGNYQYGPATGVTPTSWSITDSKGANLTTQTGTFDSFKISATENYTIIATANYTDGAVPVTNIGNSYADGQIKAGTTSGKASAAIRGYRQGYYIGQLDSVVAPGDLTSTQIRGLSKKKGSNYASGSVDYTVKSGAATVIIAVPADKTGMTKVVNTTVNADMTNSFTETIVSVGGADSTADSIGDFATNYKVYAFSPAMPYGSDANLTITLG